MINYVENIEKTLEQLMDKYGPDVTIGILPLGPLVIPYVAGK